mgnify:CR=1 FL=1
MDADRDELEQSRDETRAAFANRALIYAAMFEELSDELGPDRATEVMKRAIYRRGVDVGRKYRAAASSGDLEEVGRIFCEGSPCDGALFEPGVEELSDESTVLRMESCPLVDAWREEGLEPDEIDALCAIAAAVDEGTFEGAGLELTFLECLGQPGGHRCLLEITLP